MLKTELWPVVIRSALLMAPVMLLLACTQLRQDQRVLEPIDPTYLPAPDLTLEIDGLGPCTDQTDRTLRLSSQDPVVVLVHGCFASSGRFRTLAEGEHVEFELHDSENGVQATNGSRA